MIKTIRQFWHAQRDITDCPLSQLSRKMVHLEVYGAEAFLTLSTIWAGYVLCSGESNYKAHNDFYSLLERLHIAEPTMSRIAFCSVILEIIGYFASQSKRTTDCGALSRCLALSTFGFFWMAIGVSFVMASADALFAVPTILMGLMAWWTLVRFPKIPGEAS